MKLGLVRKVLTLSEILVNDPKSCPRCKRFRLSFGWCLRLNLRLHWLCKAPQNSDWLCNKFVKADMLNSENEKLCFGWFDSQFIEQCISANSISRIADGWQISVFKLYFHSTTNQSKTNIQLFVHFNDASVVHMTQLKMIQRVKFANWRTSNKLTIQGGASCACVGHSWPAKSNCWERKWTNREVTNRLHLAQGDFDWMVYSLWLSCAIKKS